MVDIILENDEDGCCDIGLEDAKMVEITLLPEFVELLVVVGVAAGTGDESATPVGFSANSAKQ